MGYFALALLIIAVSSARVSYPVSAVYINSLHSWWGVGVLAALGVPGYAQEPIGYNIFALAFWSCQSGPLDAAYLWAKIEGYGLPSSFGTTNDEIQKSIKKIYNSRGIRLIVSAFGATEFPTTAGENPKTCATKMAAFVNTNNLDGADADWEDNQAMEAGTGEAWIISFTMTLRSLLPSLLLTHAPQAPYFKRQYYKNGAYITVNSQVGSLIDLYLIQFYNQGSTSYNSYVTLFKESGSVFSGTSVSEIVARGVPQNKMVIGKPVIPADAANTGWVSSEILSNYFSSAYQEFHWYAGLMTWQYVHDLTSIFANTALEGVRRSCRADSSCI